MFAETWKEKKKGKPAMKNLKTGIIITAAVLMVLFFLPIASISVVSFSSWHMMTMGQSLLALKLLIPAIIIIIWLFVKSNKKSVISLCLSVGELAACVLGFFLIKNGGGGGLGGALSMAASAVGVNFSMSIWFFLEIALALFLIILSFLAMRKGAEADLGSSLKDLGSEVRQAKQSGIGPTAHAGKEAYAAASSSAPLRRCNYCGEIVEGGAGFCGRCGTKYTASGSRTCLRCGTALDADDDFCPVCGAKQASAKERLCIKCGKSFGDEYEFCPYCGKKYVDPEKRVCRSCGAELPVGADFCGKCGTRLE